MELILENLELKFSNSSNSHDPLEKDDFHHSVGSAAAGDLSVVEESLRRGLDYAENVDKLRQRIKYACFSIDKNPILNFPWDKGCFRSRMWSQYSDSHRGICIVFSMESLVSSVATHLQSVEDSWMIADRVSYSDEALVEDNVGHIDIAQTIVSPSDRIQKLSKPYLFSKLKDYENESEYRISFFDGSETQSSLVNIAGAIEGLILGHGFPGTYFPVVKNLSQRLKVPVTQVSWFRGKPNFWKPIL